LCRSSGALQRFAKRAFDIIISTTALIVFSPLFLLVSLAIKIESRGPIFVTVTMYGYDQAEFQIFRFRSNACLASGEQESRSTAVGWALHRTGIDRFPVIVNVLLGDISIVGTCLFVARPAMALQRHILQLAPTSRFKPGITGWAQVHRSPDEHIWQKATPRQIQGDNYYMTNWSLCLDAKLIFMTLTSIKSYAVT